ncbi:MAG: EamA family transporter [Gammaproteobacteria bacterium]|nr:EamA family transporter [Gammaproteobacteria bacterium]MAY02066.1 EamA family transporter [Gammaproteobacteria bacterium]|tara:strand:- start:32182 stop:33093 length:912 start_codon:yes stop_codon:yes gene_type:complete
MQDRSHWQAYGLLVFTTWCWGLNTIFSRLAVEQISPMQLVMFRWLGVILILLVFARKYLQQDWPILRQHLLFLTVLGCLGFTVFNFLFYLAGHYTTALNIGILQGSVPVFVLILTLLVFRQGVTAVQAIGIVVTLVGVVTVASGGSWRELRNLSINRGDIYVLIACFLYAVYSVSLSRRPQVRAISLFTVMAIAAWIISLPLLAVEVLQQGWQAPTFKGWLIALAVTILPSLVAQIFFIKGVALIGPNRAGVFINLVPVFAAIMAVMFLQENFEQYHAVSLALVLGGISLSELGRRDLALKVS